MRTPLRNRFGHEQPGFALPLAIGMGLIMVLVGTTLLLRSQDDQVTASLQKATAGGLSVAETGITRVQALLNDNRVLAQYNRSLDIYSWETASTIPGVCRGATQAAAYATAWQDIDRNPQGQFRVSDYQYRPETGVSPGAPPNTVLGYGNLQVEARMNPVGTDTTQVSTSTHLQVRIPVTKSDPRQIPPPGLIFSSGALGNQNQVQGNLLFTGGCRAPTTGAVIASPYVNPSGQRIAVPSLTLPPLPKLPWEPPTSAYNTATLSNGMELPRVTDNYQIKVVNGYAVREYQYRVDSINLGGDVTITPGKRVTFYLGNSISIGGGSSIQHNCAGYRSPGARTAYSNSYPPYETTNPWNEDCQPTNFQVFGYGKNFDSNATIANPTICLNGNGYLGGPLGTPPGGAFIIGPAYGVGAAGTGGTGGFTGTVWVRSYGTCGSSANQVVFTQTTTWDDLIEAGLSPQVPPMIAPFSTWQRREAVP